MTAGVLVYIALVIALFGKTLVPPQGYMFFGDDVFRYFYFYWEFFRNEIYKGIIPWWNPYLFGGMPFMANPQVSPWYPLNWLFLVVPLRYAFPWYFVFHMVWAMLGMRKLTGSWIAGIIFGLSGFLVSRIWAGHLGLVASASWLPWVVWAFTSDVPVFWAPVMFCLQLLAGYQTMAFFSIIAVGIMTISKSIALRSVRPLYRAVGAGIIGIGLAAIQLLPEQEFFRLSIRTYDFPYSWVSYGSMTVRNFIQLLNPFYYGNQYSYTGPPPNFAEQSVFLGVGGFALSLLGLWRIFTDRQKYIGIAYAIITLFGIWVSLGFNAPVDLQHILWKIVPMYHYLRIPPRHLILVAFGLSGLAGIGFTFLSASLKKQKVVLSVISGIVVVELFLFARNFIELRPVPGLQHNTNLISELRKDTQPYRVLQNFGVWLPQRDEMDFNSTAMYGVFSATGYDPSILRAYYEYVAGAVGEKGSAAVLSQDVQVPYVSSISAEQLDFLNIKYIMVPSEYDPFAGNARYARIREDAVRKYRLYENTTVKTRFFFDRPSCGNVSVTSYSANEIRLSADVTCTARLLSSEVSYPGWEAFVDTKKVDISKEYSTFRTLFIHPGKHTIVFRYFPIVYVVGGLFSCISVVVLFFIWKRRL